MKQLKEYLSTFGPVFVVCDRNVEDYARRMCPGLPLMTIEAEEGNKTLATAGTLCKWLLENGADRDALLLAIGGGVTTDIAGFCAGIYKRGIKYANVPTTLLSQVDAAIGGKTGVNLESYKNIIGVFKQPEFSFISSEPLKSLPRREFLSGAAEMLKTFIIADAGLYRRAVKLFSSDKADDKELEFLVSAAGAIKRRVVKADPFEHGLRRILNLGHTFGHAIEWYEHSHDVPCPMTHGEAVAAGIIQAAKLSESLGVCAKGTSNALTRDFKACGLPTTLPCERRQLKAAIAKDKKAQGGSIRFVLIKEIGKVIVRPVSIEDL